MLQIPHVHSIVSQNPDRMLSLDNPKLAIEMMRLCEITEIPQHRDRSLYAIAKLLTIRPDYSRVVAPILRTWITTQPELAFELLDRLGTFHRLGEHFTQDEISTLLRPTSSAELQSVGRNLFVSRARADHSSVLGQSQRPGNSAPTFECAAILSRIQ